MKLQYKSHLHPMIHVFKNKSGRVVREVLCYNTKGMIVNGKANHRYDPVTCGWNLSMTFIYSGPLFACRRCHRHIWSKEASTRCPQCGAKLNATNTVNHTPSIPAERGIPSGGTLSTAGF